MSAAAPVVVRSREAVPAEVRRPRRQSRVSWPVCGVALALLGLIVLPGLLALQPDRIDLDSVLQPPSLAHPLGTDENGRDSLARLLAGAQTTLAIGLGGAALGVALGAGLGACAGYVGGAIDELIMRLVDFALAFPSLFAILLFTALVPPGGTEIVVLIGATGWMAVARLVRGTIRELRQAAYVEAAQTLGASGGRVVVRHLLPNTGGVLFVAALVQLNRAILTEATISFLGLGIQPPAPTWGNLLIGAQNYLYTAPWLAIEPGLAITLTLLAIYQLGMRRAVSPRART